IYMALRSGREAAERILGGRRGGGAAAVVVRDWGARLFLAMSRRDAALLALQRWPGAASALARWIRA
ncbi:MAG: hypothetical protein ACREID_09555, partial [Planctomycetota bacterium]